MLNDVSVLRQYADGFRELNDLTARLGKIEGALEAYDETAFSFLKEPIARTLTKIRSFEPTVSMIGQVKSGKSTLLNAVIGQPGFLPTDVNPWTSVITNVHLNATHAPTDTKALFRFFDADEWDRLVETGGRLGEMADRAGFEQEAEDVRQQVSAMREATEERLGEQFHQLLNTSHAYPTLDRDVIDRYICYGDPEDLEEGSTEGAYADITKRADLYVDQPNMPTGLRLRDTPGVNDTFMMREQITLNAISESRVCVVVLSAHQALSTVDLALMRIIATMDAREVVIFVNRIDELRNPQSEIAKIEAVLRPTLQDHGMDGTCEIIFGSGLLANAAVEDNLAQLPAASLASLKTMDIARGVEDASALRKCAFEASGVPALHRAISSRLVDGSVSELLMDVQAEAEEIIQMSDLAFTLSDASGNENEIDRAVLAALFLKHSVTLRKHFDEEAATLRAVLETKLNDAKAKYLQTAVEALQKHMAENNDLNAWHHEPIPLRMNMKSAYVTTCGKLRQLGQHCFDQALQNAYDVLQCEFKGLENLHGARFPSQPIHRDPTGLAKTLTLDLEGHWWRKFWSFGPRRQAAEKRYLEMMEAEIEPLVSMMLDEYFDEAVETTRKLLETYLADQNRLIGALIDTVESGKLPTGSMALAAE